MPRRYRRCSPHIEVLDFADDAALHYADIRADLKKRGALIGANDLFTRHTPVHSTWSVTNNTAEFERVTGLSIANWRFLRADSGQRCQEFREVAPTAHCFTAVTATGVPSFPTGKPAVRHAAQSASGGRLNPF